MSGINFDRRQLREFLDVLALRAFYLSGILCVALTIWMIPRILKPRESALRTQCQINMKQLVLAMHCYHDNFDTLPPPFTTDENGQRLHSWRTLLLPYLDQQEFYGQLRMDEPWNSQHNREISVSFASHLYHCPGNHKTDNEWITDTSYLAIIGPDSAWRDDAVISFCDIVDGTSNTLAIVEVADSGIHWMEPRDLYVGQMTMTVNAVRGQGISSYHGSEDRTAHTGDSIVGLIDGSVRSLPSSISSDLLQQLITAEDGLPLEGWGDRLDRSR